MDRIAWLAIRRAPWCGLRLADLLVLSEDLPRDAPLLRALRDDARLKQLSADGSARLTRTLSVFETAPDQQGRKPLRRWSESTWLALEGTAAVREPRELRDAQRLFAKQSRSGPCRGRVCWNLLLTVVAIAQQKK